MVDEDNFYIKENVILPSDNEERVAKKVGMSYVKIRSGKVKIYTQEEIVNLNHPEDSFPFTVWNLERKWNWLINSKGCRLLGE
jgi:hypothetical protein